jgi:hypothetical protein
MVGRSALRSDCTGLGACKRQGVRQAQNSPQGLFCVRAHCIGPRSRGQLTALTSFATFRQPPRVRLRSALRAPTSNLRSSSPHKSPPPGAACREGTVCVIRSTAATIPQRRARAGCAAPVKRRAAQGFWPARSAHRQLTCRRLFERSERSEQSEFGDGPRDRAAQGSRSEAQAAEPKRSSLPGHAFAAPTDAKLSTLTPPPKTASSC